jgi:hypothetical protein
MNVDRPVYKLTDKSPGPDLTASAGTMVSCSMIFTDIDNSLASRCLQASKTYILDIHEQSALTSGITYDLTVKDARKFYTSSDLHHHIFFGASMMFLATGKQQYKIDAHNYAFLPDTRALYGAHKFYSVWPSWDNGWFETAAIMINMPGYQR